MVESMVAISQNYGFTLDMEKEMRDTYLPLRTGLGAAADASCGRKKQ